MFDFGFSKLLILSIVALVVIGPERLPRVARTLGHFYGRLQRYVTQVKADIHREMEDADFGKVKTEFESAARSFQQEIESKAVEAQREIREVQDSIEREAAIPSPPARQEPTPSSEVEVPSPQLELGIEEPPPSRPSTGQAAG